MDRIGRIFQDQQDSFKVYSMKSGTIPMIGKLLNPVNPNSILLILSISSLLL